MAAPENGISVDDAAYQSYLKGRFFVGRWDPGSMKKSVECFQDAITRDPEFALAHVGLAEAYFVPWYLGLTPTEPSVPKAEAAIRRALELDPEDPYLISQRERFQEN